MEIILTLVSIVALGCGIAAGFWWGKSVAGKKIVPGGVSASAPIIEKMFGEERKRIANGLHDDTVQRMVAVRFRLEQILYSDSRPFIEKEVNDLRAEIDDIIQNLRFLIKGLTQPRFHQQSFSALIQSLVDSLNAMHHLSVVLVNEGDEDQLNLEPDDKENLYYIIHEVCHNFLKSSMGFRLLIKVNWRDELFIHIEDNGQGITRARGYGYGMETIQMRAKRIGASVQFPAVIGRFEMGITLRK